MHTSLITYYERIFAFKQYHQWSISEVDDLLPWELDVMTSLLSNYLESQDMRRKQAAVSQQSR
jgi:hypothetical protein|tara:strand:- start:244 stop:432 length:189 start_codon:yes stop_codon:yes gene_type:complete